MRKKNTQLTIQECETCHFVTKNAYIFKRHKIRCKRENFVSKKSKVKLKPSGALLFASASNLDNADEADDLDDDQNLSSLDDNGGNVNESQDIEALSVSQSGTSLGRPPRERNAYVRTYRCHDCPFYTVKSKAFLYHGINVHKRNYSIFCCNFCEYSCKHRHKVQRHLKLVHRYNIDINDILVEHHSDKLLLNSSTPVQSTSKPTVESPVKNISPLKVKIALTTPASRQAARGRDLGSSILEKAVMELRSDDKKLYKCRYCLFTNSDKYRVSKHVQSIHVNAKSYQCNMCDFITTKKKDYYIHKVKHSDKMELHQCTECNYTSNFKPNLDRHRINHLNNFAFKCKFCSYSCDHEGTVKRHMANSHTDNEVNVSLMFPETSAESSMESEQISDMGPDDDEMSVNLSENDLDTESIPNLRTIEGSFFCPICGLKYRRSTDLNRHMKHKHKIRIREYLKDYGSPEEMAAYDASLDDEEKSQEKERPVDLSITADSSLNFTGFTKDRLKCSYCSYLAKWPSDLRRHMLVHTVEKRYKCPQCMKQYKYVGDLNVHLRRDHNKEPGSVKVIKVPTIPNKKSSPAMFKCPSCPYTSPWKSEVDRHSKLHKDDKAFRCMNCPYQTHWKGDIRRHMYKHHPGVMTDGVILEDVIIIKADRLRGGQVVRQRDTTAVEPLVVSNTNADDGVFNDGDDNEDDAMEEDGQSEDEGETSDSMPQKDSALGLFKCDYCPFVTNAPSKLNAHVATHTNLKQYMCPVCGRRGNWKWDLRKHIRKDHPSSTQDVVKLSRQEAEATIQKYLDSNPVVRREHHLNMPSEKEETGQGAYQCSACDFSSTSRVIVSRHIRSSHSGQSVDITYQEHDEEVSFKLGPNESTPDANASIESFSLNDLSSAALECLAMQTPDKPYMCAECGKSGSIKADIKKHYHYRHANQPIKIIYADGTDTKLLPVEASIPGKGSRKLSSSSSTSSLLNDNLRTPSKEGDLYHTYSAGRRSPANGWAGISGTPQKTSNSEVVLKPFVCAECGKRAGTKSDIKKHYNYIHPGKEVRIVYQENNSPFEKFKSHDSSAHSTPSASPSKSGPPLSSNPKVFGYIKPFKCSECGHRSNWKWDLNKHMRMKHPNLTPCMIILSEEEARSTYEQYMLEYNHSIQSVPAAAKKEKEKNTVARSPIIPSKGVYKQFKCSGCPYRSNWRSDIHRHTKRKHGGRAHVFVMDTEEAKASLTYYDYNPRKRRNNSDCDSSKEKLAKMSGSEGHTWKCGRCPYKNKDKKMVIKHLNVHNVKAFKCTLCSYATNYRSSAYRHVRVRHHSDNIQLCKAAIKFVKIGGGAASKGESSDEDLKQENKYFNLQEAEPNNFFEVFRCKLCQFQSSWRSCVTRHLREKHKGSEKGKVLRIRKYLKDEGNSSVKKDAKGRKYRCTICPFRTLKSNSLRFHLSCHKKQPNLKQEKCPYCPYYVVAVRLLRQHIKLHEENIYDDDDYSDIGSVSTQTSPVKGMGAPPTPPAASGIPKRHRCEKCPYTSNSKNDYLYHKQFHKPKPGAEFKCQLCEYWVTHRRLLKQHMKVHETAQSPSKSSVQSSPCKSDFSESSSVYDMVQLANYKQKVIASKIMPSISQKPVMSPMKIACSVGNKPGYVFRNGVYKKLHKCKKCPYVNVRLRNLHLHEMMHGGGRTSKTPLMKCPHCDYYVGSRGLLSHHLKVHQANYMVDVSDTSTSDLEAMEGVKLDDESDNKSDIVDIPFESKVDTLYEIAKFKKYSCEKCPYASAKRSHYERHVELHGSKQRCPCKYCDYSVPSRNLLAQHEKLHMVPNQNLLVAQSLSNLLQLPQVPADVALASALPPLDTKESFTVNVTHDHLEMYENSAEAEAEPKKLYRCDRCPYANVRRDHLLSHLKFHMIKSDLACPYCDYSASKQHLLTQHIKVHFSPLPELSNWLAQNGQLERVQETKETDITEALYVAQLLQGKDDKNNKESVEKDVEQMEVAEENVDKVCEIQKDAGGETSAEKGTEDKSKLKDMGVKAETMEVDDGEQPSTSSDCKTSSTQPQALSVQPSTSTGEGQDQMVEDIDHYICQYCDREFAVSDQLLRHEMQHLIGNNFECFICKVVEQKQEVGKMLPPPAVQLAPLKCDSNQPEVKEPQKENKDEQTEEPEMQEERVTKQDNPSGEAVAIETQ